MGRRRVGWKKALRFIIMRLRSRGRASSKHCNHFTILQIEVLTSTGTDKLTFQLLRLFLLPTNTWVVLLEVKWVTNFAIFFLSLFSRPLAWRKSSHHPSLLWGYVMSYLITDDMRGMTSLWRTWDDSEIVLMCEVKRRGSEEERKWGGEDNCSTLNLFKVTRVKLYHHKSIDCKRYNKCSS